MARKKARPIRPNPFIATFVICVVYQLNFSATSRDILGGRPWHGARKKLTLHFSRVRAPPRTYAHMCFDGLTRNSYLLYLMACQLLSRSVRLLEMWKDRRPRGWRFP